MPQRRKAPKDVSGRCPGGRAVGLSSLGGRRTAGVSIPLAGDTLGHEWLSTEPKLAPLPSTEAMQALPSEGPRAMGKRHKRRAGLLPRTPDALEPLIPLVMGQPQSNRGVCSVTTPAGVSCLRRTKQYFLYFLFFICLTTNLHP